MISRRSLSLFVVLCFVCGAAFAASPSSGTISPTNTSSAWQGQTYTAAAAPDPGACPPSTIDSINAVCDHFFVTVNVDSTYWQKSSGGASITITWADPNNDFDLYIYDQEGNDVTSSASGGTTSETALVYQASGVYEVVVVPFLVANSGYSGTATFVDEGASKEGLKWSVTHHGACCEGNLAAAGDTTYVLLPELTTGNDIKRSRDSGKTWTKKYPPADVSVPFGIEGDLHAFGDDIVYFGTELTHGVAARSEDRGDNWTVVQIPVAFAANDQAWGYMGPLRVCPTQTVPYVMAGWYRIGSVALFSCDGGLTWPIQTPLAGANGDGPIHVVCEATARPPSPSGDTRIQNANFSGMRSSRHGGWGTDGKFYWSEAKDGNLYVYKTGTFGAVWDGVKHPLASGTANGHVVTWLAFDDKGTLYILHANKLYVSFDQGESIKYVHTLPRYGNDTSVGDLAAQSFAVKGGTVHIAVKESSPNGVSKIWYLQGKHAGSARPSWREELVDTIGGVRLDFMQIVIDGKNIPTIGYTTPPDFSKGVTTASRTQPVH